MSSLPTSAVRYGTVDQEYARSMASMEPDLDGPVWMVNLMKYRQVADYADGRESTITGQQADDLYAPLDTLAAIGAEVVLFADVESQLLGDEPKWDRVAVVKYPTRRSFIEMQARPDFIEHHVHKDAGMEQTIIIATTPIEVPELPADAPGWDSVPHPPTAEDPAVMVIHVLKYNDTFESTEMATYTNAAGAIAVPEGVRLAGWFGVDGTVVGDGRSWDQVRFNAFPSKAAFMTVVFDPDRLAAQRAHRETSIADTYTMILRPIVDKLTPR